MHGVDLPVFTLPVFILSDQPTCCSKCGTRTIFTEKYKEIPIQNHMCPRCGFEFIAVDDTPNE